MPIYEYKCQKCGTFEVTQRITEKPLSKCPTCKRKGEKADLEHLVPTQRHRLVCHRLRAQGQEWR